MIACYGMLRKKEVYNPNMKNHELYNRYFQIYKDAYKALSDANIYGVARRAAVR